MPVSITIIIHRIAFCRCNESTKTSNTTVQTFDLEGGPGWPPLGTASSRPPCSEVEDDSVAQSPLFACPLGRVRCRPNAEVLRPLLAQNYVFNGRFVERRTRRPGVLRRSAERIPSRPARTYHHGPIRKHTGPCFKVTRGHRPPIQSRCDLALSTKIFLDTPKCVPDLQEHRYPGCVLIPCATHRLRLHS